MAEVIARLKVESKEYDSKIERARSGLLHMEEACRKVGGTLAVLEKDEKEFVQSLGQMETVSKTASGRVSELTKAFTDLSVQYKRLTQEEKQGDYGKALQASLNQLKTRIIDAKAELKDVQVEINGSNGVLDTLASKFGVSTQMLTGFGAAAAAIAGAAKVMSDALKSNEEMLDVWGAATESAQSTYNAFLDSLNSGDISGFLSRIREIINAASDAYDALDQLGTFNAFNQINVQRAQTQFTEAYAGYRTGESTKSDVKAAADAWKNELETRRKMEQEAYLAKIREIAQQRGVDADALTKALSGSYGSYESLKALGVTGSRTEYRSAGVFGDQMVAVEVRDFANEEEKLGAALRRLTDEELESLQGLGAQAERTATEIAQIDKQVTRLLNGRDNTPKGKTEVTFAEGSIGAQEQLIADLQKKWKEAADDDSRAKIKTQIEAATAELDRMTGKVKPIEIPVVIEGEGGFTENNVAALRKEIQDAMSHLEIGSEEYLIQADRLADLNSFQNLLKTAVQNGVQLDPMQLEGLFDDIDLGLNVPDSAWAALVDEINAQLAALNLPPIELDLKTGAVKAASNDVVEMKGNWTQAAQAVAQFGSALQSVEDPTAKVAGIIAEAIASVAAGAGGAIAQASNGSAGGPWGWLAFAISATATMVSTIAAIKTATSSGKYAQGGIIPGTSFSGDKLTANVNSGELILNRAQQNNIAAQLTAGERIGGNLELTTKVSGEDLLIILNNTNRARGGSRGYYSNVH